MTPRLALTSFRSLAALSLTLALAACGDSVATTDTLGSSTSSTGDSTTTDVSPTTTTTTSTTDDSSSGGMTGTETGSTTSTSTDPTTGTSSTTEAVSATETTGTTETGTTDTSTTSTSDTSTTSTTDTSTTDTSTTDTSTGDTEGPPKACFDVDFPVTAALCGDGGPACATVRDELVSDKQMFRNDMPAIALNGDCEPGVLYSEAVGGFHGFYAERTGPGAWTIEPTPMTVATGAIESEPEVDATWAMVDDGAFGSTLWRRENGQWTQQGALAGPNHVRAPQLVRDSLGALHVGHIDSNSLAFHEVFDGAWSKEQVLTQADIHVRLALTADAAPRLTAWSSQDATWKLHFMAPPAQAEVVTALGSNLLDRPHSGLALVGAEATPWVLAARKLAGQQLHEVVLAHRTGPATWAFETLAAESPAEQTCDAPPNQAGEQCMYDYHRFYPLALLASVSEVRAIYLDVHHQGTLTSQCENVPFPMCFWASQVDATTSELRIAWPGSQPAEHQVAATGVFTDRATGRLDTNGGMHLTFYHRPPGAFDPVVRYLMIGG